VREDQNILKKKIKNEKKEEKKTSSKPFSFKSITTKKGVSLEPCVSSSIVVPKKYLKAKNKIKALQWEQPLFLL